MPPVTSQPFKVSDDDLAQHLADLSVPTLLLSCVHITGDLSILDGPHQPHGLMANEEQGFHESRRAKRRTRFRARADQRLSRPGVPTAETDSGRGIATDDELGRVRAD